MRYADAELDFLARAMVEMVGAPVRVRHVERDGAARAATMLL